MSNHRFSPVSEDEPCCNLSQKAKICLGTFCVLVVLTIAAVVGVLWGLPAPKLKEWDGKGTTPNFPEIVLGRCYTYTKVLRPELSHKDCRKIGKAFMDAFLSKDPCSSTERDYQPLLELTNQTVPCNKTLFWSKSSELAHQYTTVQQEMFTLEDTLLGYIADGLKWCGDADSSEVNYGSCPTRGGKCINNTFSVFWNTVSKRFGVDNVLCLFYLSTFGSVEIYNLRPEKVPTLQAWVMHDIGDRRYMLLLCTHIFSGLFCIIFFSSHRPIKFLQCVKNPEHSSCRSLI
uniref:ADP-ribosyl cyclase/cyclic ADP-ribose hydrolase 1 n=1 Tax=Rhinolophus ferrumequinum TaxID=59479 RepID=A0A671E0J2_RHIFE